jgi:arylsulfatase
MRRTEKTILGLAACIALFGLIFSLPAGAQQTTGEPGSPSATTTIGGKQIPPPPSKFGGVIKESATDSKPWWPPRVVPPKGAPNVLLIMTDDQGYGVPSTFGGVIPTPSLDRIANAGLRYTQFHSTALCSPTRAALITGRNHHSVGFGVIGELSTGYPGYDSVIGPENATIGEILKENGYATSWFGKNHNTPGFQYSSTAGPFEQWPSGMGFQYFYGFMGGETDQVPQRPERGRSGQTFLSLLCSRGKPLAAPANAGVDRQIQGQVRHGLERHARADLRKPEAAGRDSSKHAIDALAR